MACDICSATPVVARLRCATDFYELCWGCSETARLIARKWGVNRSWEVVGVPVAVGAP